ncbi:TPA: hypothetical protein RQJ80_003064 [Vibrio vulnificus]|uniref:hypothetical protein n=1 Tax=Vibrio vulnificus TaxID=672 RepID=UPI0019D458E9|nr:hypothetical protein [Vibrio vulnificus]ELK8329011.1 hypothetical protein [Vibrio vulnificus]ELN6897601.1 hypothetical protein [Vibrio vulnificus]MBN8145025.1 hypothetical protein [Vibrio vulnificus]HAS6157180.1 hypothetical protein [Vibrio vulnificus]HAS6161767.1 hypothetical protein [Vibrio vulnificus]
MENQTTQAHETELTQDNGADFQAGFADLDALDATASGVPADDEQTEDAPAEAIDSAAVVGMVEFGLFMSEQYIGNVAQVDFQFDAKAKEKFLESCGPLIGKYGLTWLAWFDNYKEEILFGVASVGLAYSGINTVKRLQREQLKQEAVNDDKETQAAA